MVIVDGTVDCETADRVAFERLQALSRTRRARRSPLRLEIERASTHFQGSELNPFHVGTADAARARQLLAERRLVGFLVHQLLRVLRLAFLVLLALAAVFARLLVAVTEVAPRLAPDAPDEVPHAPRVATLPVGRHAPPSTRARLVVKVIA